MAEPNYKEQKTSSSA